MYLTPQKDINDKVIKTLLIIIAYLYRLGSTSNWRISIQLCKLKKVLIIQKADDLYVAVAALSVSKVEEISYVDVPYNLLNVYGSQWQIHLKFLCYQIRKKIVILIWHNKSVPQKTLEKDIHFCIHALNFDHRNNINK